MKDQILKIAKVKSEKEFYKKYPSEEAFMKAHGKAFKKAAMGKTMVQEQLTQLTDFELSLTIPYTIYEQSKIELWASKVDLARTMGDLKLISKDWVYKNVFNYGEDNDDAYFKGIERYIRQDSSNLLRLWMDMKGGSKMMR